MQLFMLFIDSNAVHASSFISKPTTKMDSLSLNNTQVKANLCFN